MSDAPRFIAVIGRSGQVASALADLADATPARICFFARPDFDLAEPGALVAALRAMAPDTVINAAGYTAVDRAEDEPQRAYAVNAQGPAALAAYCASAGARPIHLSTDYVFDGRAAGPYAETAPVNPLGVYGASKLAGERAVRSACARAVILRTAWVFSAVGKNFVTTMIRVARETGALRVVNDQTGGPTPAAVIAAACLSIAAQCRREPDRPGGLYHLSGTPPVTWYGFARTIVDTAAPLIGRPATLTPITTTEFAAKAARPANSVLDCARIARDFGIGPADWRQGLRDVIAVLAAQREAAGVS